MRVRVRAGGRSSGAAWVRCVCARQICVLVSVRAPGTRRVGRVRLKVETGDDEGAARGDDDSGRCRILPVMTSPVSIAYAPEGGEGVREPSIGVDARPVDALRLPSVPPLAHYFRPFAFQCGDVVIREEFAATIGSHVWNSGVVLSKFLEESADRHPNAGGEAGLLVVPCFAHPVQRRFTALCVRTAQAYGEACWNLAAAVA